MRLLVLASLALVAGCASSPPPTTSTTSAPAEPASFEWPKADKWKGETIPFPLGFAPDLPYKGTEELRFAPGFFDASAPGYFSYAFVWWVEPGPELAAPLLETQLKEYFVGLTRAVAKGKFEPDVGRIEAHLSSKSAGKFEGTVRTIDAFKTHAEVSLAVRASAGTCGDHRFLLVSASPRPSGDPMWTALDEVTAAFRCKP